MLLRVLFLVARYLKSSTFSSVKVLNMSNFLLKVLFLAFDQDVKSICLKKAHNRSYNHH